MIILLGDLNAHVGIDYKKKIDRAGQIINNIIRRYDERIEVRIAWKNTYANMSTMIRKMILMMSSTMYPCLARVWHWFLLLAADAFHTA